MLKKFLLTPLVYIFFLGLFFRLWNLTSLPPGFHVDEVKVGWNAYSLWKTGRDDWLHPFPVHYNTFGDERPAGYFYAAVPSLMLFGENVFAVRFTSALFGSLAVVAVFYFVLLLTRNSRLSAMSSMLLAVSPWHITLSRASSEGIISTTLVLFGLIFLLKSLADRRLMTLLLSAVLLSVSYFFYHTSRILVPVFVFIILGYVFIRKISRLWIPGIFLFLLLSVFTLIFAATPAARARLSQVSIFNDPGINFELQRLPFEEGENHIFLTRALHNKIVVYASRFFNEYTQYLGARFFLTPGEAKPLRYTTASRGLLLYTEFILLAIGLVAMARGRGRYPILPFLLLLASPLPAAVTTEDAPNLHRALFMSPFISVIAAYGFNLLWNNSRKLAWLLMLLFCLDFFHYAHMYIVHNPARDEITLSRNTGVTALISRIDFYLPRFDRIYLTNRPDNLYPWFVFLSGQNPAEINPVIAVNKNAEFTIKGVTFSQYRCPSEYVSGLKLPRVLAVDAEGCQVRGNLKLVDTVTRSGGGHPYTLWEYSPGL